MASGRVPGDFRRPDVYAVELDGAPRLIPASTSLGAMIGESIRGRTDRAILVSSWGDFQTYFGSFPARPNAHLIGALSVFLHFQNGGGPLYFARVTGNGAASASALNLVDHTAGTNSLDTYAQTVGAWGNSLSIESLKYERENVAAAALNVADAGWGTNSTPNNVVDVTSLQDVEVGDVLDALDEVDANAGYAVVAGIISSGESGNYTTRGLVSGRNYLLLCSRAQLNGAAGIDAASFRLRSNSQHRASSRLSAQIASAGTAVNVQSGAGFQVGSYVTVLLGSINNLLDTRDFRIEGFARVTNISGNVLTLAGQLVDSAGVNLATAVPVDVKAYTAFTGFTVVAAADTIGLTSVLTGSDGNSITTRILPTSVAALAALGLGLTYDANGVAVHVAGQAITIYTSLAADPTGNPTAVEVVARFNLTAAASALATAALVGGDGGDDTIGDAYANGAVRNFTGGAYAKVVSLEFSLDVKESGQLVERHEYLSIVSTSPDYVQSRLGGTVAAGPPLVTNPNDNNQSTRLLVQVDANASPGLIADFPRAFLETIMTGGTDGNALSNLEALGVETQGAERGVYLLEDNDDIDFFSVPGYSSGQNAVAANTFAQRNHLTFLFDTPQTADTFDEVIGFRYGDVALDSSYAKLFTSWQRILDPRDSTQVITVPPTAFASATYSVRGHLGAHLPTANMSLVGIVESVIRFTDRQRDALSDAGINPIRKVNGTFRIFDDLTLYRADSRRFGNVRRWLNYFERTLLASLPAVQFQPANTSLMSSIAYIVRSFLRSEHARGALYPSDNEARAFSVKCDSETTTADDLAVGRINVEVSVSPAVPARQIVVGIRTETGGITITETAG